MIYLGSDHRGFALKEKIKLQLLRWQLPFKDLSPQLVAGNDYPPIAEKVARQVANQPQKAVGILICGSGVGVSIAANKIAGIRAGLGLSGQQIRAARRDDDINVLCLAADYTPPARAQKIVRAFLETEFAGQPRQKRRLLEIAKLEKNG